MKKSLLLLAILIINPVCAKNVKVEALSDFSTANPPKTWSVKVVEGFVADAGFVVNTNSIIEGKITDVKSPKRLKRNASFRFIPEIYYDTHEGYSKNIERNFEGKYSSMSELSVKSVAKKGAITAGNMFVSSFIGPGVALVEGAIKNERDNRAKSAAVSVYESTPLSYVNKGKDLEFKKGDIFIMSFKLKEEDKPNYTYEMAD